MKVTVYTGMFCSACTSLKQFLQKNDVDFEEKSVQDNVEDVIKYSIRTVPVLVVQDRAHGVVIRGIGQSTDKLTEILALVGK